MILLDTDISSAFAKSRHFKILIECISSSIFISKNVYEELQVPLSYGYKFPKIIFQHSQILFLNENEEELYLKLRNKHKIDRGESESLAIAKHRQIPFTSFDRLALDVAILENCKIISPVAIFIKILTSVGLDETIQIVKDIEEADNRNLSTIQELLVSFNEKGII